jgi:hypothetical protein
MKGSFQWAGTKYPSHRHSMRTGSMIHGHLIGVVMVVPLEMHDPIMTICNEGPGSVATNS